MLISNPSLPVSPINIIKEASMTSIIKTEIDHLKFIAQEIKDKIEMIMSKPEEPNHKESLGELNSQLDAITNEIILNTN